MARTGADFKLVYNDKIVPAVDKGAERLAHEMARQTANAIADDSPFDTGHNKSTISWSPPGRGPHGSASAASVHGSSGYSGILHTGTRHMVGRPYFFTGLATAQRSFGRLVEAQKAIIEAAAQNPAFTALQSFAGR